MGGVHFLPQGKLGNNPRLFFLRVFKLLLLAASWITIYQLVLLCSFGVVVQVVQVQVVQVEGAEVKEEAINLFVTVGHDLCFPPVPQTWKIYVAKICFAGKGHIVVRIEKATKLKVIIFSVFVENISMSNWIELCSCYSKVCHTFSRVQSAILM